MPQLAERYELGELLGSGGMARVVAAVDHRLQRRVAVKLIREEYVTDATARARLLREARAAAAFQHPNAVAVFDVGEDAQGRPFIVMEPIEGETLADHLAHFGPLAPADAIVVGTGLLDALAAAHRRGLVHRDVKPANVLLPADSGVKLSDFGIAKGLDGATGGLTATGQIMGTPAYLSPEQAAGHPATARSDLYALGVVLYESLTGFPPFSGDTVRVAVAHQQEPVPRLAEQAPATPPALAEAVERALAKDPDQRFADARQMRAALARAGQQAGSPSSVTVPVATVAATDPRDAGATADTRPVATAPGSGSGAVRSRRSRPAIAIVGGIAVLALLSLLLWRGVSGLGDVVPDEPDQSAGPPGDEHGEVTDPNDPTDDAGDGDLTAGGAAAEDGADEGDDDRAGSEGDNELDHIESPGGLAALLASDPERAGEAGIDLLDELLELIQEDDPGDRHVATHELLMDVGGWMREDELDTAVGRVAVAVLEARERPEPEELAEVSRLLADVAAHAPGWDERAGDLADDLTELLHEDDASGRADRATKLIADLEKWREDGDMSRQRAEHAIAVLEPLTEAHREDEDEERGPGRDRGQGQGRQRSQAAQTPKG